MKIYCKEVTEVILAKCELKGADTLEEMLRVAWEEGCDCAFEEAIIHLRSKEKHDAADEVAVLKPQ